MKISIIILHYLTLILGFMLAVTSIAILYGIYNRYGLEGLIYHIEISIPVSLLFLASIALIILSQIFRLKNFRAD